MSETSDVRLRPMNVVVLPRSDAGRRYRAAVDATADVLAEAIAPGFPPDRALDLQYFGGKTIANLSFVMCYLGGSAAWADSDRSSIDAALGAAMSDAGLNDIVAQYFNGTITSTLASSHVLDIQPGPTVFHDTALSLTSQIAQQGVLQNLDPAATVITVMLPRGVILSDANSNGTLRHELDDAASDSLHGLAGYHGSTDVGGTRYYFAVGVYSETSGGQTNGIPVFADPWKNVVATLYHELNEARTDADVEVVNETGDRQLLGWYSPTDGEIGDIPIDEAEQEGAPLSSVFLEVPLAAGGGTVPVQLMYSNRVHGPELPGGTAPFPAPSGHRRRRRRHPSGVS